MKPTLAEKKEALTIVQTLLSFNFRNAITYAPDKSGYYYLSFNEWESENGELIDRLHIKLARGASKICILYENEKWVIKFNIDRSKKPYDTGTNYCRVEYNNYRAAVGSGFGWNFAEMYSCGKIDGIEVYLQERVRIDENWFESSIYNYLSSWRPKSEYSNSSKRYDMIEDDRENMDVEDFVNAILGEGNDDLVEFLESHEVNDLHSGNWGFTHDGRIVMIDYSGFFG